MGRPTKTDEEKKFKLSVTIDRELNNKLNKYVDEHMVVKSKVVQKVIKDFLESYDEKA